MKENNTKTHKKLQKIFREVFDDDALVIARETTADDIEDWDSYAQISIVTGCEKVFDIHFEISEILVLKDVGDMMNLIERKLSA